MAEFKRYQELVSLTCADIPMEWRQMEDHGVAYLVPNLGITQVFARYHCKETGKHLFVTETNFERTQANIQRQFAAKGTYLFFFFLFFRSIIQDLIL